MSTQSPDDKPAPPSPATADPDAPGSPLRAVLTGLAINIGGSFIVDRIAATLYVLHLTTSGLTEDQVNTALAQSQMPSESGFAVLALVGGAACSVAAGFACARIVQRDELRVGGLMAIVLAVLLLLAGGAISDDMLTLLTASTLACNLLGAKYGAEANARRRALKAAEDDEARPS